MKKILTMFLAVFAVITMTRAAEGGTLTSSATPIDPSETVTLTYDGTGTNFANWQPSCFIHAWLVAADGQTFSKSYSTAWASCNGDNDYAALDSKVKMTYANVAGKYTISMNIKSFFNVEDADLPKIAKLGVIVRAQYEGDNNKTNDMFVNVAVASQGGGNENANAPLYVWNGIGSTTAATQSGGSAEAVQTTGTNVVAGASQKGNYCFKVNKGFTSGEYYIGIALTNGVNAGDTVRIAYFRTSTSSTYVLGMDFSADKASASTTYQILSKGDPQALTANGTPVDSSYIVPTGVSNAKYVRVYRNSGSTGLYVAKLEIIKKVAQGGGETPTPENDVTLYYVNNANWTTVNAYIWKGEGNAYKTWPGEAMTKTNDKANGKDVYSYTFPESYNKIIFNDGSNQTSDLTWNANEPYYFDGEWYESLAAIPAAVAPAKFYITGDTALVVSAGKDKNMAWHSNAIKVEKDSFVFENMAAGIYHMKVSLDGTWNDGQVKGYSDLTVKPAGVTADNDGNICFTLAEVGRVVVTYKVDNEVVTFTVAGNFFVETPAKFYITGDTALVVSGGADKMKAWKADAIKVEKDSFVFENMAAGDYHMKVVVDGNWEGGQVKGYNDLTVKPAGVTADNDGNICFTLAEGGRVVVTYKVDNEVVTFTVAGNFFVETPAMFYITGDTALVVSGGADKMKAWKADAIKVEKDSFVFENMAAGDYHMKVVVDGNWEGGQVKGYNDLTVKPAGVTADNDGNICFTLAEAGRVVVTYKVENEVTTFTVAGNFYVAPVEPVKYYIAGSMTEWETNKVELVEAATDSFRVVITLEADSLYEYKVVSVQGENKVWYGLGGYAKMEENNCTGWWFYSDGSSNVGLQSGAAGSYTFIVKMRDGHAEVTVIYPEATSIISLEGRDEVRKVMRNGQIYIIKNGTVYNAFGAIVE